MPQGHGPATEHPHRPGGASGGRSPIRDGETEARERQGHGQGHTAPQWPQLSRRPAMPGELLPGEGSEDSVFPPEVPAVEGQGRGTLAPAQVADIK